MFDLLLSADMMLEDPDNMADLLHQKLGVYKHEKWRQAFDNHPYICLLYTSPSPRDGTKSRMPSSA